MKIKKSIIYTLTILSFLFFSQCSKEETPILDEDKPTVSILEPQLNDTVFVSNDPELHIEFTAQDNFGLEQLHVTVTDSFNNEVFSNQPIVGGLKVYSFHKHFIVGTDLKDSKLLLSIFAEDESGNTTIRTVSVFVAE